MAGVRLAERVSRLSSSRTTMLATKAVDTTRRQEHKRLTAEGDDRLSKTKYLWLKSQENLDEKQRCRFEDVFSLQLQTAKAWGLTAC